MNNFTLSSWGFWFRCFWVFSDNIILYMFFDLLCPLKFLRNICTYCKNIFNTKMRRNGLLSHLVKLGVSQMIWLLLVLHYRKLSEVYIERSEERFLESYISIHKSILGAYLIILSHFQKSLQLRFYLKIIQYLQISVRRFHKNQITVRIGGPFNEFTISSFLF